MIYTRPDYFHEFSCVAEDCIDTCCAGWQIMIDKESLEKYKNMRGGYIWKIMSCVDWENDCFRQDNEGRCAFLNGENLCELQINEGHEGLCKTCREYPRHTEEFEGVREITLSASCPEVARILMERTAQVHFIKEDHPEIKETEDFGDFDPFLYSVIEDAREAMIDILQNRSIPVQERAVSVLGMAHDMQRRINHQELFECNKVIEKYKKSKSQQFVHEYVSNIESVEEEDLAMQVYPLIFELELLRKDWDELLHKSQETLFCSRKCYAEFREEFEEWKEMHTDIEIHIEQILVYFLYTYFPGAVYDGQVFAKAQMAVYCTWMIELLWLARWVQNDGSLLLDEMIEILYRFSREIEHSDENLECLDKMMIKKRLLL